MDISIDLNGLKKTEATKIKIDELVDQIKELHASEDCGDKAAAIIFYDYNERAKKRRSDCVYTWKRCCIRLRND